MGKQNDKDQGRSTSLRLSSKSNKLIPRDISESLGKLPPQAVDLEEHVLGAVLIEKNAILDIADFLKPDHFYVEAHKEIYIVVLELFQAGDPVDMGSVVARLRKNGKIELIGGPYKIAEITSRVTSAASIEYHSRVIIEMSIKRALIQMASQIHHDAYDDTTDVFELMADIDRMMEEVSDGSISTEAEKHVKDIAIKNIENLQSLRDGKPTGQLTGLTEIDRITHGLQNSDLIVVAARPGMAKTALVAQILYNMAVRGEPTAMFSLEMPGVQIVNRLAIGKCEIDPDKIRTGNVSDLEFELYVRAQGEISKAPMYIDDSPMLNIIEILARATRLKKKFGIKAIAIDYIQLVNGIIGNRQGMNRDQEIGVITRILKGIAKKLDIPVIAISSLSRGVETRGGDKRPQLSDLRESGNIESDADVVMFLYRPEYYRITVDEDGMPTHGKAELIFAKHRNGALGTAVQKFIGKFTKFTDWIHDTSERINYMDRSKDVLPNEDRGPQPQRLIPYDQAVRRGPLNATPPPNEDTPF
jgi:replicative DNA helicase